MHTNEVRSFTMWIIAKDFSGIHLDYKCLKANWNEAHFMERVDGIINSLIVVNDMNRVSNSLSATLNLSTPKTSLNIELNWIVFLNKFIVID